MQHDTLADALVNLKNYDKTGKNNCMIRPASKLTQDVLKIIQKNSYIGNFERIEDGKGGMFKVKLVGRINNCGAIKPRYPVKLEDLEEMERKYLPAREFGMLILTTPKGVLTHAEAREKKTGGALLAYIY